MGVARTFLTSLGTGLGLGLAFVGGLSLREVREHPQTLARVGYTRLLASRGQGLDIGEGDYFRALSNLLKAQYVEPVTDDRKLVSGAVRGMVGSLGDPHSMFFSPEEFRVFKAMRGGSYEGIGAWLAFEGGQSGKIPDPTADGDAEVADDATDLPRLTIISVVPGGPADRAGVRAGDKLEAFDGEWVVNSAPLVAFRKANADFLAKKIDLKTLNAMRADLKAKLDKSVMPLKVRERATSGAKGTVRMTVLRGDKPMDFTIEKAPSQVPGVRTSGDATALPFVDGAPEAFAAALKGKPALTVDLRNNVLGDFGTMRRCLALVAPTGTYGGFVTRRSGAVTPLTVERGTTHPRLLLRVDPSTRGAAQIFALALTSKGLAALTPDSKPMTPDRTLTETIELPDGAGYTLATGDYVAKLPVKGPVKKPAAKGKGGAQ